MFYPKPDIDLAFIIMQAVYMQQEHTQLARLLEIMARLRDPETGCPWDIKQTFNTIAPYTIEEAYEVSEAIASGDRDKICDELGDLLLQVVFHAQIATEEDSFTFEDVAEQVSDKMERRHPHVFGNLPETDEQVVKLNWEAIKKAEREDASNGQKPSILDGITRTLPAMVRAAKLQKRAASVGFDWPDITAVIKKMHEELEELHQVLTDTPQDKERLQDEIGDILFVASNLARKAGLDPETALLGCNRKFERRFHYIEERLNNQNIRLDDASLEQMDALWNEAKNYEF